MGRARSIHEAANASARGARSTMARRPSSGRGNLAIRYKGFTVGTFRNCRYSKNPMFRGRTQRLRPLLTARFGVDAHHRCGSQYPVTDPGTVAEQQLQSVRADNLDHHAPGEIARIRLLLLSELRLDLGRQAEVFALGIGGTNLVTQCGFCEA